MTTDQRELFKAARSIILDEIKHEKNGEPRLFGLALKQKIVEEITNLLGDQPIIGGA